jgi:hypothetical protein
MSVGRLNPSLSKFFLSSGLMLYSENFIVYFLAVKDTLFVRNVVFCGLECFLL